MVWLSPISHIVLLLHTKRSSYETILQFCHRKLPFGYILIIFSQEILLEVLIRTMLCTPWQLHRDDYDYYAFPATFF